ncbi:uncharacterized protein LOC121999172 [Zingiber officinale]|uniref:uncharacterized protein LOC121999172 n=1 Tax=Zingiber officinale TaxID=94328 RepID=UPI001C4AFAD3|nr:uncharacterized protein LOC121999172 [Zingiber officinale]
MVGTLTVEGPTPGNDRRQGVRFVRGLEAKGGKANAKDAEDTGGTTAISEAAWGALNLGFFSSDLAFFFIIRSRYEETSGDSTASRSALGFSDRHSAYVVLHPHASIFSLFLSIPDASALASRAATTAGHREPYLRSPHIRAKLSSISSALVGSDATADHRLVPCLSSRRSQGSSSPVSCPSFAFHSGSVFIVICPSCERRVNLFLNSGSEVSTGGLGCGGPLVQQPTLGPATTIFAIEPQRLWLRYSVGIGLRCR